MANPLARDKNRQLYVECQHDLLEGARVLVTQEVIDERSIFAIALGTLTIGNTGGLHNALVSPKVVDEAHKAFIEHRECFVENCFSFGNNTVGHSCIVAEKIEHL